MLESGDECAKAAMNARKRRSVAARIGAVSDKRSKMGLPDIDGSLEVGRTSESARSHTGADAAHGVAGGRMVRALQTVAGGSSPRSRRTAMMS